MDSICRAVVENFYAYIYELSLRVFEEEQFSAGESEVIAAQQRLRYCMSNISILCSPENPATAQLLTDFEHVLRLAQELREDFKVKHDQQNTALQIHASERNIAMAQAGIRLSEKGVLLADQSVSLARNARNLTILAFLFIPLSFVTGLFSMHVKEMGFPTDGRPIWHFFAVSVPLEIIAMFIYVLATVPILRRSKFLGRHKNDNHEQSSAA
jgi:Mg2+ and Co2+ transporter CorA